MSEIITTIITPLFSFIAAIVAIVLTVVNLLIFRRQLGEQEKINRSQSMHAIIDAHRELFTTIIGDDKLLSLLRPADLEADDVRAQILGSLLINHCLRNYLDRVKRFGEPRERDVFVADAIALFRSPVVRDRWHLVRDFHPDDFVAFIEEFVLPLSTSPTVDYPTAIVHGGKNISQGGVTGPTA